MKFCVLFLFSFSLLLPSLGDVALVRVLVRYHEATSSSWGQRQIGYQYLKPSWFIGKKVNNSSHTVINSFSQLSGQLEFNLPDQVSFGTSYYSYLISYIYTDSQFSPDFASSLTDASPVFQGSAGNFVEDGSGKFVGWTQPPLVVPDYNLPSDYPTFPVSPDPDEPGDVDTSSLAKEVTLQEIRSDVSLSKAYLASLATEATLQSLVSDVSSSKAFLQSISDKDFSPVVNVSPPVVNVSPPDVNVNVSSPIVNVDSSVDLSSLEAPLQSISASLSVAGDLPILKSNGVDLVVSDVQDDAAEMLGLFPSEGVWDFSGFGRVGDTLGSFITGLVGGCVFTVQSKDEVWNVDFPLTKDITINSNFKLSDWFSDSFRSLVLALVLLGFVIIFVRQICRFIDSIR